jgi:hypothetical protein
MVTPTGSESLGEGRCIRLVRCAADCCTTEQRARLAGQSCGRTLRRTSAGLNIAPYVYYVSSDGL